MVIQLYYVEELNVYEIAKILELTNGRISQIKSFAIKKLRNEIKDSLPIPFYGLFDFYKKVLPSLIKLAFDLNGYYKVKLPYDQN